MANAQSKSLIEDCLFLGVVFDPSNQIWETNGPEDALLTEKAFENDFQNIGQNPPKLLYCFL